MFFDHEKKWVKALFTNKAITFQTMTAAISTYELSKLDLFTPNRLHGDLPSLAIGPYAAHGNHAAMILEADVIARQGHIWGLLGEKAQDPGYMRKRIRTHERLAKHLGVYFNVTDCQWKTIGSPAEYSSGLKSMSTEQNREQYAKNVLESEWEAMGIPVPDKAPREPREGFGGSRLEYVPR